MSAIGGVASFSYDGCSRRAVATIGGTAKSYLHDGRDVVQEQQGGSASANLLTGPGVDERFSRGSSTFLTDALGSTVALASDGVVATAYGYDPYGVMNVSGTASDSSYQYIGRENDGTGVYAYRNRYYNPVWGRFVSEDPIGLRGGINVYAYVGGNPVRFRDPSGNGPLGRALGGYLGGLLFGVGGAETGPLDALAAQLGRLVGGELGSALEDALEASMEAPGGAGGSPPTQPSQPPGACGQAGGPNGHRTWFGSG